MAEPAREELTVDGCTIGLWRHGAGPTLFYLHGAGGLGGWPPALDALSRKFAVVAPEHPSFDGSDTPDWLDDIEDLAFFYLDVFEALDLTGVHLVGASLGGWLAAEIAVRDTSRLATLTLVSAAGLHVEGLDQLDLFLCSDEERLRGNFVDPKLAEEIIARRLVPENEDVNLKNRTMAAKLAWQPRWHDKRLPKWLHRIDIPTLVLWGDSDRLFPPPHAARYAELIPGAKTCIVERCGHALAAEKPEAFVSAITEFAQGAGA